MSLFVRGLRVGALTGSFGRGTDFAGLSLGFTVFGNDRLGRREGSLALRRGRRLLRFWRPWQGLFGGFKRAVRKFDHVALMNQPVEIANDSGDLG